MQHNPLSREDVIRVIEGKGCASRVPLLVHLWVYPGAFTGEKRARISSPAIRWTRR